MPFLIFLGKYWKYIVLVLFVLAVFGYWKSLTMKIASQEKQIIELKVDLKISQDNLNTCVDANNEFKRLTDIQNAEIIKQAELAKKFSDLNATLMNNNKKLVQDFNKVNEALKNANLNSRPCVEAIDACYAILEQLP